MSSTDPTTHKNATARKVAERIWRATIGKNLTPSDPATPAPAADLARQYREAAILMARRLCRSHECANVRQEEEDREEFADTAEEILAPLLAAHQKDVEELAEMLWESLYEHTTAEPDGWRRGMGRSEARYAGDRLVEMGLAEAHPENKPSRGRVNRWRRIPTGEVTP